MTTDPHTMTGAELQTLREAAGLSRETLAGLAGVEARTVKHWETRKGASVPADVAETVTSALRTAIHTSRALLAAVQATHKPGDPVALLRYRQTADMIGGEHLPAWSADAYGAILACAVLQLTAEGYRPRVAWFDPEAYHQARGDIEDNQATREAWARVALARTMPHPGDQPPEGHTTARRPAAGRPYPGPPILPRHRLHPPAQDPPT